MKILFAGFLSFLPFFAVASDSDGGVIAGCICGGLLFIFFVYWIGSSIESAIRSRIDKNIERVKNEFRRQLISNFGKSFADCELEEAILTLRDFLTDKRSQMNEQITQTREACNKEVFQIQKKYTMLCQQKQMEYEQLCLQKDDEYATLSSRMRQEYKQLIAEYKQKHKDFDDKIELLKTTSTKFPPLARALAKMDELTVEVLEKRIDSWRAYRAAEIVKEAKQKVKEVSLKFHAAKNLIDSYEALFPWLEEYRTWDIEDFSVEILNSNEENNDIVKNYLSPAEYEKLAPVERNQKALDRYLEGHKSKVQIGRLYERFVGYQYEQKGYNIKYFGATEGVEDLGRDLIARKGNEVIIIQCKYWSKEKTIRENVICQLYGTTLKYRIEHKGQRHRVSGALVTSTKCSDIAREFAEELGIDLVENYTYKDYPMIKCNIGKNGEKIYHLPFDQMYDKVKIETQKGEMYAMTCFEAELNGFRRAFKWRGENGTA